MRGSVPTLSAFDYELAHLRAEQGLAEQAQRVGVLKDFLGKDRGRAEFSDNDARRLVRDRDGSGVVRAGGTRDCQISFEGDLIGHGHRDPGNRCRAFFEEQ